MPLNSIITHAEKCVGCLRCQLTCSYTHHQNFNITKARIRISFDGLKMEIGFTEDCIDCGACVKDCYYEALTREIDLTAEEGA